MLSDVKEHSHGGRHKASYREQLNRLPREGVILLE